VLRGEPALVDSTDPRRGEKATYYSAVCLERGEAESMVVTDDCNAETSTAFLRQLRAKHVEPLIVIWDNSPAHHGPEIREEVTANTCFGTAAKVQEKMDSFFAGLAERTAEVQRRCRTILQAQADALMATANQSFGQPNHVEFTFGSVWLFDCFARTDRNQSLSAGTTPWPQPRRCFRSRSR
jgi:hypothetical protein